MVTLDHWYFIVSFLLLGNPPSSLLSCESCTWVRFLPIARHNITCKKWSTFRHTNISPRKWGRGTGDGGRGGEGKLEPSDHDLFRPMWRSAWCGNQEWRDLSAACGIKFTLSFTQAVLGFTMPTPQFSVTRFYASYYPACDSKKKIKTWLIATLLYWQPSVAIMIQ